MDRLVEASALSKTFPDASGEVFAAVDDLSITVRSGELTALVGPDGAGKTTLMRMLAGLLRPTKGSLTVLGIDVTKDPQSVQDRISYMPQRFGLYEDLSVLENLTLYADLHNVATSIRQQRFDSLLSLTDLHRFVARPAGKLSGGMKQKLGLACTLVRSPDLLLLDEPSVGVDPLSRRELWKIIGQLRETEALSVIVSTSYMDEAERCQQIYILHQGRSLGQGSAEDICHHADGLTYGISLSSHEPARVTQARLLDARDKVIDAVPAGSGVRFSVFPETSPEQMQQLCQSGDITPRPAQFEDAFMRMLREKDSDNSRDLASVTNADDLVSIGGSQSGQQAGDVIRVQELVRTFGDFTAVASTSFSVRRGEIFGLLGPNGAGKTTTFRMLCGLLPASGGSLEVAGVNLRTARAEARSRIGYVAQKFSLYGNLTVRENLTFFGGAYGLRGKRLRQRIDAVLAQFQLQAGANSGQLPAGYKQRLAMAAGLIHEPDILFLDEPTSGIDPQARRAFWRTITALAQAGVTIIITTHFMEEAEYCDRIAIQDAGKLLALGTPQAVRSLAGLSHDVSMNTAFIAIVEQSRAQRQSADGSPESRVAGAAS